MGILSRIAGHEFAHGLRATSFDEAFSIFDHRLFGADEPLKHFVRQQPAAAGESQEASGMLDEAQLRELTNFLIELFPACRSDSVQVDSPIQAQAEKHGLLACAPRSDERRPRSWRSRQICGEIIYICESHRLELGR